VTLGLFGFLIALALAMAAQSLPMYAGLAAFPRRALRILAAAYLGGVALYALTLAANASGGPGMRIQGLALLALGGALVAFISISVRMMQARGRLPERVAKLAPQPHQAARAYQAKVRTERANFGPFVPLIASAFLWAALAGVLLVLMGALQLAGIPAPFTIDPIRHALTAGFITLLLSGVSVRMIPGFSGGRIADPRWVTATLWLGNSAALLRVGAVLFVPVLAALGAAGGTLYAVLFGLSGPLGLAVALCLVINLWPAIWPAHTPASAPQMRPAGLGR
jgi:hypothetical protein